MPQYDAVNTKILVRSIHMAARIGASDRHRMFTTACLSTRAKYDSRFVKSFVWAYIANASANGVPTTGGKVVDVKVGDTALYFTPTLYPDDASLNDAIQANSRFLYYLPLNTYLPITMNFIFPGLTKWLDSSRPTTNATNGSKDWMLMRYAETVLLLAEGYGRKGDFVDAAKYINEVRRAPPTRRVK